MHQDQRIGLALGVLLVGACAAFFFRNETRELPNIPQLKNARELDEAIAQRPTRPYIKGIEVVEAADRRRTQAADDQESSSIASRSNQSSMFSWNLFSPFSRKGSGDKVALQRKGDDKATAGDSDIHEFAPLTLPNDSQVVGNDVGSAKTDENLNDEMGDPSVSNSLASQANERTYVVQKGETLSSIAAKLLGDRGRFHELFAANLDRLDNPDDVKLGMTLRIPKTGHESAPSYAHRSRSTVPQETPAIQRDLPIDSDRPLNAVPPLVDINSSNPRALDTNTSPSLPKAPAQVRTESPDGATRKTADATESKKFIPVRRTPWPRQAGPQAQASDQSNLAGRKLSQISQEPTTAKVAR